MTAVGLLALWALEDFAWPLRPDERKPAGWLRLDAVARLPVEEREALMRLVCREPTTPDIAAAWSVEERKHTTWIQ